MPSFASCEGSCLRLLAAGAEVKSDFVRLLVILRNAVEWNDLAELMNQNFKELAWLLLRPDGGGDANQGFVALRGHLVRFRECNGRGGHNL